MRLRLLALCAVPVLLVFATAAQADAGAFSGSITPTACGPMHPFTVAAGETTIDVTAAATVSANDITLELFDPAGNHVAHGDSLTSPEEIHYASSALPAGTWNAQVCPFTG